MTVVQPSYTRAGYRIRLIDATTYEKTASKRFFLFTKSLFTQTYKNDKLFKKKKEIMNTNINTLDLFPNEIKKGVCPYCDSLNTITNQQGKQCLDCGFQGKFFN